MILAAWRRIRIPGRCHICVGRRDIQIAQAVHRHPNRLVHLGAGRRASMAASRRARAMILAPRSWPSRPGFRMRIGGLGMRMCVYGLGLGPGGTPLSPWGILQGSGLLSLAYREGVSVKY